VLEGPLAPETTLTLGNDFLELDFTSTGGALTRIHVRKYNAELIPPGQSLLGTTLLLPEGPRGLSAAPMSATTTDSSVTFTLATGTLTVARTYVLGRDYTLRHTIRCAGQATGIALDAMSGLGVTEENVKEALGYFGCYYRDGKKARSFSGPRLKKEQPVTDTLVWVALRSKYFTTAVIGQEVRFDSMLVRPLGDGRVGFTAAVTKPEGQYDFLLYLGPIEGSRLRRLGSGLDALTGQGWTRPIEIAMMWLLRLFYHVFRNWGVAIMVFSILMKAALWPLTRTQTQQMRKMQLLQPKLNELKAKFKDDAQKLNAETMQLYKLYKINPLSGCLPMVLQLPIFWALYAVLRNTIEMRGAHFVLWLKDLSQADALFGHIPAGIPFIGTYPVGLLPVLMGVSFIGQNMITSTDKKNWAMTIIFPVFITAIFLNLPSGLQLYWFMYNILSIGETLVTVKGGNLWRKKPKKALSPEAN
jgi:YidC/Oxa1 family membrane protein insertase